MNALPAGCDLTQFGLDPATTEAVLLHRRHGHALYRLRGRGEAFVLKCFDDVAHADEVRAYTLLRWLRVPTLPLHGMTANALLLGDVEASAGWQLAVEADMGRAEVGIAVARWYRVLHERGRAVMGDPHGIPASLRREGDEVDAAAILHTARALGLDGHAVWLLAAAYVDTLKAALRILPETLIFNDFHWTNLALVRDTTVAPRAVVFDYHLLGVGHVCADYRNVCSVLTSVARAAFCETYGEVDGRAAALDAPLATLYALHMAVRLPRLPRWAQALAGEVTAGILEADLRRAIAAL